MASGCGGMVAVELDTDLPGTRRFLEGVELFQLAESLGGVESLVGHPASMSHSGVPEAERLQNGITCNLVRLSVGIEDVDDLRSDLDGALKRI